MILQTYWLAGIYYPGEIDSLGYDTPPAPVIDSLGYDTPPAPGDWLAGDIEDIEKLE